MYLAGFGYLIFSWGMTQMNMIRHFLPNFFILLGSPIIFLDMFIFDSISFEPLPFSISCSSEANKSIMFKLLRILEKGLKLLNSPIKHIQPDGTMAAHPVPFLRAALNYCWKFVCVIFVSLYQIGMHMLMHFISDTIVFDKQMIITCYFSFQKDQITTYKNVINEYLTPFNFRPPFFSAPLIFGPSNFWQPPAEN